jgi:hypothetical protein
MIAAAAAAVRLAETGAPSGDAAREMSSGRLRSDPVSKCPAAMAMIAMLSAPLARAGNSGAPLERVVPGRP